jgi:diadenosine tetraphosphate (Ap4A) HIT family hydrolase
MLMTAFAGDKLNVAALGNQVPQLHVHHIVRRERDAAWPRPVWGAVPALAYTDAQRESLRSRLRGLFVEVGLLQDPG